MATSKSTGACKASTSPIQKSPRVVTEDRSSLEQAIAAERAMADKWINALDAMRCNKDLPDYVKSDIFPVQSADSQSDIRHETRARTNRLLAKKRAEPVFETIGAKGRYSEVNAYYVADSAGRVVFKGRPSELCCYPGLVECLSPRQLSFLAAGLAAEAALVNRGRGAEA